ncbi:hypothetical protein TDB9533_04462 [Thalassocella blandensis]|nr:hypothetical protein TDB9533_04462 [Thalassocella blandensis]
MKRDAQQTAKLSKAEYKRLAEALRVKLVNAQYDLKDENTSVIILLAGNDLPGCEEFIDVLQEWVDVRYVDTRAFRLPTEEEQQHPPMWRYWQAMPRNGRIAVFYGAWIMNLVLEVEQKKIAEGELEKRLLRLSGLENLLLHDNRKVLKIWLHASEDDLKKRLKKYRKNPDSELYVGQNFEFIYKLYKRSQPVIEKLHHLLNDEIAWQWVDGSDKRTRNITIAQRILALLESDAKPANASSATKLFRPARQNYLGKVDVNSNIENKVYKEKLKQAQLRLKHTMLAAKNAGVTPILAFEGWDAAGKGGVIRRITQSISAWSYRAVPIAAPTPEEMKYHYLWRFWKHIPRAGKVLIFDRTWYGRVLVERVEGFAKEVEWQRAYEEINDFEAQLVDANCCVLKFWLHIDAEEQMKRFKQREQTEYKKYKITEEDYRNREKWQDYESAVNDMVELTSTKVAPWHLVAANDKRFARIEVMETLIRELEVFIEKAVHSRR